MAFSLYVDLLKSFPALEEIMKLKYLLGGGEKPDPHTRQINYQTFNVQTKPLPLEYEILLRTNQKQPTHIIPN